MSSLRSGSISFLNFLKRRRSISFGKMLLSLRRIACATAITSHAFVDLWHVSDGYPLYKQMKALEKNSPNTLFSYLDRGFFALSSAWEFISPGCRICLSATAPAGEPVILRPVYTYEQFVACLRNPFLRELARTGLLQLPYRVRK